jgi:hypothetical protein
MAVQFDASVLAMNEAVQAKNEAIELMKKALGK